MKKTICNEKYITKGVSTLDVMKRKFKVILLLLTMTAFCGVVYGGHSILDLVDPSFNPNVQTNAYTLKWVNQVQSLSDGKILAFGGFNTYNDVPVGKLVRLNANGSLDTTFNNQTITASSTPDTHSKIFIQADGKIVLRGIDLVAGGQLPKQLLRLNADGTLDSTFNFTQTAFIDNIAADSLGRLLITGSFTTPNGTRLLVRLNDDGSPDNSFNFTLAANTTLGNMTLQGNKPIVISDNNNNRTIYRLNEDGSPDISFTPLTGMQLYLGEVQPGNKILYGINTRIFRLNENGGNDNTFQSLDLSQVVNGLVTKFTGDGKIVFITRSSPAIFRRFLPNGAVDPSFNQYTTTKFASYTVQPDDSIVMGDSDLFSTGANSFVKLMPSGVPDPTFNPGGRGFQNLAPGTIQSIEARPDGKILLGGKFDLINNISRYRLVRLNTDSTVDTTFRVNTTAGNGNYFSIIRDIYQISTQTDGKIVVSGFFDYVLNGVTKSNLVRLNSTGSIDTDFNLTFAIPDWSQILGGGQNKFATYSDGKLMVGTSRFNQSPDIPGPIKLNAGGTRDTSFNSTLNSTSPSISIDDVAIQPNGKIIASGSYDSGVSKSFVARFNTDGSLDSTFPYVEEPNGAKSRLVLLPNGKIIISKTRDGSARIQRLNSDGSTDNSFNSLLLSDSTAKLNALLVLPNGKIFVGGKFTITVNGQTGKNLLQLNADGNFEPTVYNLNEEVLCLAADSEGRVLVGGGFTVIDAGGNTGANRSYVARLTDSRTQFDFDGDGKADVSVFRASTNIWYRLSSSNSNLLQNNFGIANDVPTPADFDGDGKTDLAIFRPSTGTFWYQSSINNAQIATQWGQNGDIPLPSDFDGDGKADFVIYRPNELNWYRYGSTGIVSIKNFGSVGDKPVIGDFDGDGKSDVAIYRPSTGTWWYQSSINNAQIATQFGISSDVPSPADFDGDGKTDFAVYRPSTGVWYVLNSSTSSATIVQFGIAEDKPVAADYDGDGKADIAVFRPSTGVWYLLRSTSGFMALQFGILTDVPAENAFIR